MELVLGVVVVAAANGTRGKSVVCVGIIFT